MLAWEEGEEDGKIGQEVGGISEFMKTRVMVPIFHSILYRSSSEVEWKPECGGLAKCLRALSFSTLRGEVLCTPNLAQPSLV